jgi:hypothetical protein
MPDPVRLLERTSTPSPDEPSGASAVDRGRRARPPGSTRPAVEGQAAARSRSDRRRPRDLMEGRP